MPVGIRDEFSENRCFGLPPAPNTLFYILRQIRNKFNTGVITKFELLGS